ncbi:MAG: DUF2769 domain-containing protein [Methanoregula sp.]|jgi:hypothetical protein|uniref:DUF2769 domain-containing protein n=1 Tax=Methanoregula sp. TaxID=2052170 RepID=UPI0025D4F195|nr:DUF2769 domain-containing protein [Methanoregula sp.]MCK9631881.1 DUF2769 domain-containing protein [Methanoregula sp.]
MNKNRQAVIDQYRKMCICDPCPTCNECMRADDALLFCVIGRSPTCTFEKKECLCAACPVTRALGLKHRYYCIRGTEREQP